MKVTRKITVNRTEHEVLDKFFDMCDNDLDLFEEREVEKWFAIMIDNTVKVFDTLAQYGDWYYELSREERDNIYRVYTTLNAKDRQKLKKLNLI